MLILFIGDENLQNDALIEIIRSENNLDVEHLLPAKAEEKRVNSNPSRYKIVLVDLTSFEYSPDAAIKLVKKNMISDNIIAMHNYKGKKLIQPIIKAGADTYISMDLGSEVLLEKLHELSG